MITTSYPDLGNDLTAPLVALTLADKAAIVDRFVLTDTQVLEDWQITVDPDLDGWVVRWQYCRLTIGEPSDLILACAVARERTTARHAVDASVMRARRALGWGRGEPRVRCVVCRTGDVASRQHAPGSQACLDTQAERRRDHTS